MEVRRENGQKNFEPSSKFHVFSREKEKEKLLELKQTKKDLNCIYTHTCFWGLGP